MSTKPILPVVALLVMVACSGPSGGPSQTRPTVAATANATVRPTTSAVATASAFTSPLYGYTITLPAGWSAGAAILRWDGKTQPGYEEPEVDKFGGPVSASAFAFASPVTLDLASFVQDRIEANARDHGDTCPAAPEVQESIEIGSQPGVLLAWNCGILINQAVTVHDGLGFAMTMRDTEIKVATNADDRAILEALVGSVVFPT